MEIAFVLEWVRTKEIIGTHRDGSMRGRIKWIHIERDGVVGSYRAGITTAEIPSKTMIEKKSKDAHRWEAVVHHQGHSFFFDCSIEPVENPEKTPSFAQQMADAPPKKKGQQP